MKFLIVFVALFAVALAAPTSNDGIVKLRSEVNADGFSYETETADGTHAEADGKLKQVDKEVALVIRGSYRFTDDKGVQHFVTYVADENGYQPQSDDLSDAPQA